MKDWTKSHACKGIMILMIIRNDTICMLANHGDIVKIHIISILCNVDRGLGAKFPKEVPHLLRKYVSGVPNILGY